METTSNTAAGARALQVLHVPSPGPHDSLNQLVRSVLTSLGEEVAVQEADDLTSVIDWLDRDHFDAIVVAHSGKDSETISSLDVGLALASEYPVIVLTDQADEELTQRILADGAVDCLATSTFQPQQLETAVLHALARYQALDKGNAPTQKTQATPAMRRPVKPDVTPREPYLSTKLTSLDTPIHPDALLRGNKSGILIGTVLLVAVGLGGHRFWHAFLRYHAYGVVVARVIDVSTPFEGQMKYVHVEEGQAVRQDDPLVTIDNLALRRALEGLDNELAVAHAESRSKVVAAEIMAIKAKRRRLRSQIAEGELRSPVNGTVLRRNGFAGERVDAGKPVMTVVEETSVRVVVYYPQKSRRIPRVGDTVTLQVPPFEHDLDCIVERVEGSFEPAPKQIARHYLADEKLLPVHLKPTGGPHENHLRLGAVVMLPRSHSLFMRSSP